MKINIFIFLVLLFCLSCDDVKNDVLYYNAGIKPRNKKDWNDYQDKKKNMMKSISKEKSIKVKEIISNYYKINGYKIPSILDVVEIEERTTNKWVVHIDTGEGELFIQGFLIDCENNTVIEQFVNE